MRHEKAETLLRIVLDMQSRSQGLSIQEIAHDYSDVPLSRRTAERLRDAAIRLFPDQVDEKVGMGGIKRWRLRSAWTRGLFHMDASAMASLEAARKLLEQNGLDEQSRQLQTLRGAITALMRPELQKTLDHQIEALTLAEGVALKAGPRSRFDPAVLNIIRRALELKCVVQIQYRYRRTNTLRTYDLHPYGLLYGHRNYLVGSRTPAGPARYYILGRIEAATLQRHTAILPSGFDLSRHAEQAFGVWQETSVNVHWRFKPEAAEDAADFIFHPTQTTEWGADGSYHVRFTAGGLKEMDWHLYTWGDAVEVIEPESLKR